MSKIENLKKQIEDIERKQKALEHQKILLKNKLQNKIVTEEQQKLRSSGIFQ